MSKQSEEWVRVALGRPDRWIIEANVSGRPIATLPYGFSAEANSDSALIVAACNAIRRFAAALDCDPLQLAEHLERAHPGAMLDKLASVFGEEE